jgi:hypothetical protein
MTHSVSTNPPKVRYFVAGPVKGLDKPAWLIIDKYAGTGVKKIVEYVEGRDEAIRRAAELNAGASPTPDE